MTTLSSEPLSRSVVARLPFFWWRQQADWPARKPSGTGAVPTDDSYIPSGTADLWRSARPRSQR
jgi:hypothetical protein